DLVGRRRLARPGGPAVGLGPAARWPCAAVSARRGRRGATRRGIGAVRRGGPIDRPARARVAERRAEPGQLVADGALRRAVGVTDPRVEALRVVVQQVLGEFDLDVATGADRAVVGLADL